MRDHIMLTQERDKGRVVDQGMRAVSDVFRDSGLLDKMHTPGSRLTIGERKRLELLMVFGPQSKTPAFG